MKKLKYRSNVIKFKRTSKPKLGKKVQLTENTRNSEAAKLIKNFFLMEDEAPPNHPILSSVYYSEYSFHCLENEITPLSRRAFSILAMEFVISKKGKKGKMWYTLKPHVLEQLNSKLTNIIAA